mgnify:CR=1 FL=1
MSLLLSSAALSLIAGLIVWITGRRDPAESPMLTLGSLMTLLALPLLALLPKFTLELSTLPLPDSPAASAPTLHSIALIWVGGMIFFTLRILVDWGGLRQFRAESIPSNDSVVSQVLRECRSQLGLRRRVGIHIHPQTPTPLVAGLFRPVIYLPQDCNRWEQDTLRMVLMHELGHVARHDLWTNLAARCACVVYWFNPLVWWLRRKLVAQCEFACDARVIAAGTNPGNYASALCDMAESSALPASAMAMAGRAPLRARIERVVRCRSKGHPFIVAAALLLTVSASLGLSVVRLSPAQSGMSLQGIGNDSLSTLYSPEELFLRSTARAFPLD